MNRDLFPEQGGHRTCIGDDVGGPLPRYIIPHAPVKLSRHVLATHQPDIVHHQQEHAPLSLVTNLTTSFFEHHTQDCQPD